MTNIRHVTVVTVTMSANASERVAAAIDNGNGTVATYNWLMLFLILIPLWTMCGNLLVLLAVLCFRQLRTLSNWVIASLAATDFLVALVVQPLGIYQSVSSLI